MLIRLNALDFFATSWYSEKNGNRTYWSTDKVIGACGESYAGLNSSNTDWHAWVDNDAFAECNDDAGYGMVQVLFLMGVYAMILSWVSSLTLFVPLLRILISCRSLLGL